MTGHYSNKAHRLGVSAYFFLLGFGFASWASRIPFIQQKLSLTEGEMGLVLLSLPAGSFVSLPLSGWLVSRFGSKRIVTLSAAVYGLLLILIGLAATKTELIAALFFFGLAGNMGNISVNTQAVGVELMYSKNIMGSFHGVWSLAGFCGAAFGGIMGSIAIVPGWHFTIVAVLSLATVVLTMRYLLRSDIKSNESVPVFTLPDRSLVALGLIAFCCMLCEGTMFDWSGIYFKKVIQPSPALVGAGYTAFMSTMAASRFLSDYFTNRFGFRPVVQVSGIIIAAGLLLAVLLPYFVPALIGFLLVGVGVSSIVPMVYSAAGKSSKMSAGAALAAVSSISFFGFLIGPPLIGMLAGLSGLRLSFGVMAAIGLCVTILGSFSKRRY